MKISIRTSNGSLSAGFRDHLKYNCDLNYHGGKDRHLTESNKYRIEAVIKELYKWAEAQRVQNIESYPHFGGWTYSLDQKMADLRSGVSTIKVIVDSVFDDLMGHYVEKYRTEGNKVFVYNAEQRAYVYDGELNGLTLKQYAEEDRIFGRVLHRRATAAFEKVD